jgi:two-component system nitrogen regulation response regulator GlnG
MQEAPRNRVISASLSPLIRGEHGNGHELIARAIYQHSLRVKAPFIAINCAAIPRIFESELLGHEVARSLVRAAAHRSEANKAHF